MKVNEGGWSSNGSIGTGPLTTCGPFTVIIHGSSISLSCFDSSLKRTNSLVFVRLDSLNVISEGKFSEEG